MGYWPARETFDYNATPRPGCLTGPVLNSFLNTPSYGDERSFFDAYVTVGSSRDPLQLGNARPDVVTLRAFVHNNANPTLNESGLGVAENVRVRFELPTVPAAGQRAVASLSFDNPAPDWPAEVTDTVDIHGDGPFLLEPIPGTVKSLRNNDATPMSDDIFSAEGAVFGGDELNGRLEGCFENSYLVVAQVRLVF